MAEFDNVEMEEKSRKDKSGSNPNVLNKEALSKRPMKIESYYDILENDEGELLFTIKFVDSPQIEDCRPIMYYDGGAHAIFVKNEEITIICDFIHPGVRGSLGRVSEVLFAELRDGNIMEEYMVDVLHVTGIDEIADMIVPPLEKD